MRTIVAGTLVLALGCAPSRIPVRMHLLETATHERLVQLTDARAEFACAVDLDLARRAAKDGHPIDRSSVMGLSYAADGTGQDWYLRGDALFDQVLAIRAWGDRCVRLANAMRGTIAAIPERASVYEVADTTADIAPYWP